MKENDYYLVMVSCPGEKEARRIQQSLVFERLAACVSIIPGVQSCYRWQGAIEESAEVLLLIKTRGACFEGLRQRVLQLHPDQVPEIIALPVKGGEPRYLEWLKENT